jgi:ankyrin repeat protein
MSARSLLIALCITTCIPIHTMRHSPFMQQARESNELFALCGMRAYPTPSGSDQDRLALVQQAIEKDKTLLEWQALNDPNETLLHRSVAYDRLKIAAYLIQQGIPVDSTDKNGRTPLHYAAFGNFPAVITLLLGKGASVNYNSKKNNIPLHDSACVPLYKNPTEAINILLAAGADKKAKNDDGLTPSGLATQKGRHDLAKLLAP